MKSMKIMAYKERRGPLFTLVIPLMDSNTSWKIKAAIEEVIFNVIDKQPENRTLRVDLRVKYDSNSKSYSFMFLNFIPSQSVKSPCKDPAFFFVYTPPTLPLISL